MKTNISFGELKEKTLLVLRNAKIDSVEMEYSGGGDQGAVDTTRMYRLADGVSVDVIDPKPSQELEDELEEFCYRTMEESGGDRSFNGEGVSGTVHIEVRTGGVTHNYTVDEPVSYSKLL